MSLRLTLCSIGSLVSLLTKLRISSTERKSSFACAFVMGACFVDSAGTCVSLGPSARAAIAVKLVDKSATAATHLIELPLLPQSTRCNMTLSIHRYNQVYASFRYR